LAIGQAAAPHAASAPRRAAASSARAGFSQTFVWLYVVLLTACVVISIVVPAKGFAVYEAPPAELMARLPSGASTFYAKISEAYRSGALRTIDPSLLEGVVVFPSFHTIMALLATYAFWRTRFLWLLSLAVNAIVLISVVPIGGHYVWDVVGGALMFVAAARLASLGTEAPGAVPSEPDLAVSNSSAA
jgi:membrane-associated phospholipid phosphatase